MMETMFIIPAKACVIDPLGEVLYHVKDVEDVFTITLDKTHLQAIRDKFPFLKDGDDFTIHE
jgi:predicted amidohydrolase